MAAGHLVAGLQAPLHRDVDLDHFLHARGQFIALGKLFLLGFERHVEIDALLRQAVLEALQLRRRFFVGQADVEPVVVLEFLQVGLGDLAALGQLLRTAVDRFAHDQALNPLEGVGLDDAHLVD